MIFHSNILVSRRGKCDAGWDPGQVPADRRCVPWEGGGYPSSGGQEECWGQVEEVRKHEHAKDIRARRGADKH